MSFASLFSAAETTVAPVKSDVAIAAVHKMLINFFFHMYFLQFMVIFIDYY